MPKGSNQKLKIFYLNKILSEKTDDDHGLTMPQIIKELEGYGVTAERKSIYQDFEDMSSKLGIDIIKEQTGRETYYHMGGREFEMAEVKLLIDAIQCSKFITQSKSRELITKIKTLVSKHQAKQLQRQVYINDRVKALNENVYYNVDDIHNAINEDRQIKFKYYKWNTKKELVPRHNGDWFEASPWALTWDDENYYLVAYDDRDGKIKHYRVDKMMDIVITKENRKGKNVFGDADMAAYSKMSFGMYSGEKTRVTIEFPDAMCGVFIDRFGKEVTMIPQNNGRCVVIVEVAVSRQFYGWIFSLGSDVKITAPENVLEGMKKEIEANLSNYKNS